MVFTGTYEHSIDAKNRLAIPADIRNQLRDRVGGRQEDTLYLFVIPGEDGSLSLYAEDDFQRRAQELQQSDADVDELLEFERIIFSMARRVEIDKQGRIRLPDHLLKMAGLEGDVVILGNNDHMEVHSRQAWYEYVARKLQQNPGLLMNFRRAMRSRKNAE